MSRARLHSRIKGAAALLLLLLLLLLCAGLAYYKFHHPVEPPVRVQSASKPVLDLTFLVASDTHLGLDDLETPGRIPLTYPTPIESRNLAMIERMNTLEGQPYPSALGGRVGAPLALLLTGDLTENGGEAQWRLFQRFYGLKGGDGLLRYPVYETFGNHDHFQDTSVLHRIQERHGGTYYAFDLGGIHFVALGEAPGDLVLAFLSKDLALRPPETPIILFFHLPLRGPWAEPNWFSEGGFRPQLASLIQGRRILAIFQGHSHTSSAYRWEGIDVYNPGSVKHSQRAFLVVHISDDSMTVCAWNLDFGGWWWWHRKPMNAASTTKELLGQWEPRRFKVYPWIER